jgi:tetratricopeptide (TPR) repeat protein
MRVPAVLLTCAASAMLGTVAPPASAQPGAKALVAMAPPARVDPRLAEAKKFFDAGAAAYATGNYEAAIKAWEESYALSQKPLIFESIANAWERLGDPRKARDNLARWREAAPPEERDLLDARLRNLDARVAREDEAARKAAADRAAREERDRADAQAGQRPWLLGAIVGSAGVAAVIAGVAVDAVAASQRPAAALCKSVGGQELCKVEAQGPITSSSRTALAGDLTWAVGAAAIAAGAVLILMQRPATARDSSAPAAYLAPGLGAVVLGGRF